MGCLYRPFRGQARSYKGGMTSKLRQTGVLAQVYVEIFIGHSDDWELLFRSA